MRLNLPGEPEPLARTWAPEQQQPGSLQRYQLFPGHEVESGIRANIAYLPLPATPVMLGGWEFSLEDANAVDPNDHLELRALVVREERN